MKNEEKLIKYNLIYHYAYPIHGEQPDKCIIGQKKDRYCIFCGRPEGKTSFKKEAHVIPVALGNKSLTNWNECDTCNEDIFSVYEDDLVNYFTFERILIRGRKRKGSPKYKPVNGSSFITSNPGTNSVKIELHPEDEPFIKFNILDNNNGQMEIIDLPPFSFVSICKALVHMGWTVMEGNLRSQFNYIYDWLKGEINIYPLFLDEAFIPGGGLTHVIFEVLQSEDQMDEFPIAFRLTYGHKVITFYLPITHKVSGKPRGIIHLNNCPPNVPIDMKQIKICTNERIKPTNSIYNFNFSKQEVVNNEDIEFTKAKFFKQDK